MKYSLALIAIAIWIILQMYIAFKGLDVRKSKSWFSSALGFLCGFFASPILGGTNLVESIGIGLIAGLLTLSGGVAMQKHRKQHGGPYSG